MKRIISIIMVTVIIAAAISASFILADATTYVTYGDWLLAVESDTTYLIGGYNGNDTTLSFPETANDKAVIGVAEDFYDKSDSALTSVTLPDSYTKIESFAFYGMTSLETINIPTSLTAIGAFAFSGCTSLEGVDFSGVTRLSTIPYSCFSGCTSLSEVTFPEGLTTISDYAFSNTAVESVSVPYGVTSLGTQSFANCASLTELILPAGLQSIGEEAFVNDTALTSIYVPASVSEIGANAFYPMAIEGGSLTIDCYENTYAAQYAWENYLNRTNATRIKGDADNDGDTDINDVTSIQLYRVGKYNISSDAKTIDRVDVTSDSKITIRDATTIQLFLVGNIESL